MSISSIRVLIVEDFEPFRRFLLSTLQNKWELRDICVVSDGLDGVREARKLQPDLVLLDIGLPALNGIEAARTIREVSPASKLLFVSEHRSPDIAEKALATGAGGYVVKSDSATELLPAVKAVLEGKRYVSASLAHHGLNGPPHQYSADHPHRDRVLTFTQPHNAGFARHHEVGFYSSDRFFLDDLTQFIGSALIAGCTAIVAGSESHRDGLLPRLHSYGLDISKVIEEDRYIALDAADRLPTFTLCGVPDPAPFMEFFEKLISKAAVAAKSENPRVVIFGEFGHGLWAQGKPEAAIQMEKLGNLLTKAYDLSIYCAYCLDSVKAPMDDHTFERICAEHSRVYTR